MGKLTLLLMLAAVNLVQCDLPIHSVVSDVKGVWSFTLSKSSSEKPTSCGGGAPNLNLENLSPDLSDYLSWLTSKMQPTKSFRLDLTDRQVYSYGDIAPRNTWTHLAVANPAKTSEVVGTWTMVYDEGFQVYHKNLILFGLLKYSRKDMKECPPKLNGDNEDNFGHTKCYATDPSRTHIGWYVEESKNNGQLQHRWGCFYSERLNNAHVSPSFVLDNSWKTPKILPDDFVASQNSRPTSWVAGKHAQFAHSTPAELKMATKQMGYQKIHSSTSRYSLPPAFLQRDRKTVTHNDDFLYACGSQREQRESSGSLLSTIYDLPKSWSWGDPFESPSWDPSAEEMINQGNCGSCYAVSAAYVLQKRFEIVLNKLFPKENLSAFVDAPLSPQAILSCSPYNQGCDGGYPFLVGKHAKEFGIPTSSCMSYKATHNPSFAPCRMNVGDVKRTPAKDADDCLPDRRWFAKDYGYVGGCYECCNEENMMREIFHHGPVVVAIDAPDQLFLYRDGVFDSPPTEHGKICDDPKKGLNGWEYTNHAVVVVGWGEDTPPETREPKKFWVVRNTWGSNWGKNGYVKVLRGKNLAGIESQAVFIDADINRGRGRIVALELQKKKAKFSNDAQEVKYEHAVV